MQTLQIRNSTAEFLIFIKQSKEKTIEVIVDDESVWLSQKLIAELFDTTRNNVTIYLDYAEDQAERHIPMTMEDWRKRLDVFYNLMKEKY